MLRAFNAPHAAWRAASPARAAEPVADGVWRVRGGVPREMNVYLIEDDGGGVTVFDAGRQGMTGAIAAAGQRARRASTASCSATATSTIAAPRRASARRCSATPTTRQTPRATAAAHYFDFAEAAAPYARPVYPDLLRIWDGGPVPIAGTVDEGDDVSGFRVVAPPGPRARADRAVPRARRPRADDRLLLHARPADRPPRARRACRHAAFNLDTEQARASVRKLAGAGAERGLAGPRRAAHRRRRGAARARAATT